MKRYTLLIILVSLLFTYNGSSQEGIDWRERFKEANAYFLYEEYNEALPIYLQMLREFPNNHNIRYRIGVCYLNTPGQKDKAIDYLERASRHTSDKYRGENIRENNAPPEALFRLGDAYRVNNNLDEALEAYRQFKNSVDEKKYDLDLVDEQIRACENAKKIMQNPMFLDMRNMGEVINSRFSDYNPVVSADRTMMVFMRKLQFYDAVFFSKKVDGKWTEPENLTFQLGEDDDLYTSSLSADGKELYLYKVDGYDGNIYVSYYDGKEWSRIKRLNDHINTKYWESHASISADRKTLYFTSNRKGGYGDLDIYVSTRDSVGGEWGPPVNLGNKINTPYNEDAPFISHDGKTLYFSSYGHFNIGGYDIFYSNLLSDSTWSAPMNMGYPVNTPDDNLFYYPIGEGYLVYYAMYSEEGFGEQDIFELEIYSDEHPKKYLISGMVGLRTTQGYRPEAVKVCFINTETGDTASVVKTDTSGRYQTNLVQGNYHVVFEADRFIPATDRLMIEPFERRDSFTLNKTLEEADLIAELEVSDTTVYITKGKVRIDLATEKNATLLVETIRDSVVVNREEFNIRKTETRYTFDPLQGETILRFTLTDQAGNRTIKETEVTYEPPRTKVKPVPAEVLSAMEELKDISGKEWRSMIENTDPQQSKLYSINDLRKYLVNESNQPAEVDTLFRYRDQVASLTTTGILEKLNRHALGEMKEVVSRIDSVIWTDSTSFRLIEHLNALSENYAFSDKDIRRILMISPAAEEQKVRELMGKMEEMAEGTLKSSIEQLEPDREGITNNQELVEYLIGKAEFFGYEKEEVFRLVSALASGGKIDVLAFLESLTNSSEGALKDFLSGLDYEMVRKMTPEQLLEYVLQQSVNYPYTANQVWDLLFKLMDKHSELADEVIEILSEEKVPGRSWIVWLTGGSILFLLVLFLILTRRKKKNRENHDLRG
ncbi:MAG: tetratricopeptide repeat protein [Bacteroidales bacterium]